MADDVDRANDLTEDTRTVEINTISRILAKTNLSGECVECGEDIEPKRRLAMPSAVRCMVCQEASEMHVRLYRH